MFTSADPYIDLLKRSLTDTLFKKEPNIDDDEFRFTVQRVDHYVNSYAVSMVPLARFNNIKDCIEHISREGIPSDLIEAGVWRGGATNFMRGVLKAYGVGHDCRKEVDEFHSERRIDDPLIPVDSKCCYWKRSR